MNIIEGTARNMGVAIEGVNDKELEEQAHEAEIEAREQEKRDAEFEKMEEEAKAGSQNVEVEAINEKAEEKTEE